MLIVKSRSAAHAFIDIVRCTVGNPQLVGVVESASPTPSGDASARYRHVDRTLEAAEVISAAACEEARRRMPVAVDVHDPAIHSALAAMIALYSRCLETGEAAGCCGDATDIAEIQMTIQAALDQQSEASGDMGRFAAQT